MWNRDEGGVIMYNLPITDDAKVLGRCYCQTPLFERAELDTTGVERGLES